MNYKKIYDNIVDRARSEDRKKGNGVYYEKHHITPKCLGGSDSKENLILLTAKEHFVSHKLLVELYPNNKKVFYGWFMISTIKKGKMEGRNIHISSKDYERLRESHSKYASKLRKGIPLSKETKIKIGKASEGRVCSEETRQKLRIANTGKIRTEETKQKLRDRILPEERKTKISKTLKEYFKDGSVRKEIGRKSILAFKNPETKEKHKDSQNKRWKKDSERKKASESQKKRHRDNPDLHPRKGKLHTEETKEKMRVPHICLHCGKEGKGNSMKRWHFDNCKFKEQEVAV